MGRVSMPALKAAISTLAVAGDHGDGDHPNDAKDQGVFCKVLTILFSNEAFD